MKNTQIKDTLKTNTPITLNTNAHVANATQRIGGELVKIFNYRTGEVLDVRTAQNLLKGAKGNAKITKFIEDEILKELEK